MTTESRQSRIPFVKTLQLYKQALLQLSYRPSTIDFHINTLNHIYNDGSDEKLTYSFEKAEIWLKKQQKRKTMGQITHRYYVCMRTVTEQFEEFYKKGHLVIKKRNEHSVRLPECFGSIHQEFIHSLPQRLAPATISLYETNSRQFFEYLTAHSILDLISVDRELIENFLSDAITHHKCSMDTVIQMLKLLFTFLSGKSLVRFNPDFSILKPAYRRKPVLPHFTYDEVKSILMLIDRSIAIGKRDYAIVLVAVYTGLRLGDVLDLQLTDIDWRKHEIRIVQKKTRSELYLPLSVETGNALVDYILNGRPSSAEGYIFLKSVPPYSKLNGSCTGYRILKKCFEMDTELAEKCMEKTFHSFRRSLGSWLSMEQTPLPLISEILGHTSLESSKFYLSYDILSMSMCCLGLDGIPVLKEDLT